MSKLKLVVTAKVQLEDCPTILGLVGINQDKLHVTMAFMDAGPSDYIPADCLTGPLPTRSPAHQLEREPLKWSDVQAGRKFAGKSANNGQHYLCVITETDVHMNSAERAVNVVNVRTKMLMIDQKEVVPFDRPLPAAQFKEEFLRWIE